VTKKGGANCPKTILEKRFRVVTFWGGGGRGGAKRNKKVKLTIFRA